MPRAWPANGFDGDRCLEEAIVVDCVGEEMLFDVRMELGLLGAETFDGEPSRFAGGLFGGG